MATIAVMTIAMNLNYRKYIYIYREKNNKRNNFKNL